jgi:hypothetical protein
MPVIRLGEHWGPEPEPAQVLEPQQPKAVLQGLGIAGPHLGLPSPLAVGAQGPGHGVQRLARQRVKAHRPKTTAGT